MAKQFMLIDDDEHELEIFTQALHSIDRSFVCTQAKTLKDAVDLVSDNKPEYIFLDYHMPGTDGLTAISDLKRLTSPGGTKIVLYSNYLDESMTAKAMALGAFRCIKKPNMINMLVKRLKEILKD